VDTDIEANTVGILTSDVEIQDFRSIIGEVEDLLAGQHDRLVLCGANTIACEQLRCLASFGKNRACQSSL
jgi:hypothetical protein